MIRSIDDFERLAVEAEVGFLYRADAFDSDQIRSGTTLLFLRDGIVVEFDLRNYLTIADFRLGTDAGFSDGAEYYAFIAQPLPAESHETDILESTIEGEAIVVSSTARGARREQRHTIFIELLPPAVSIILSAVGEPIFGFAAEYRFAPRDGLALVVVGGMYYDYSSVHWSAHRVGVGSVVPILRRSRHRFDVAVVGGASWSIDVHRFYSYLHESPVDPDPPDDLIITRSNVLSVLQTTDLWVTAAIEYQVTFSRMAIKVGGGPGFAKEVRSQNTSAGDGWSERAKSSWIGPYVTAAVGWRF